MGEKICLVKVGQYQRFKGSFWTITFNRGALLNGKIDLLVLTILDQLLLCLKYYLIFYKTRSLIKEVNSTVFPALGTIQTLAYCGPQQPPLTWFKQINKICKRLAIMWCSCSSYPTLTGFVFTKRLTNFLRSFFKLGIFILGLMGTFSVSLK
jgi:hypothetical protein